MCVKTIFAQIYRIYSEVAWAGVEAAGRGLGRNHLQDRAPGQQFRGRQATVLISVIKVTHTEHPAVRLLHLGAVELPVLGEAGDHRAPHRYLATVHRPEILLPHQPL